MSDQVKMNQRLKRILDSTKKVKERFNLLCSLRADGFNDKEIAELFQSNSQLLFSVYRDYTKTLEQDFSSKNKHLPINDVQQITGFLRSFINNIQNQLASGILCDDIEQEIFCFLHTENHVAVRQQGVELLLPFMDYRREGKDGLKREFIEVLMSCIDWDYFRSLLEAPVVLPNTITAVRRSRYAFIPQRTKSVDAEEQEREATEMLRTILDFVSTGKGSQLEFWWRTIRQNLIPILYPKESFACGIIPAEVWDGFCNGVPACVHNRFVQFFYTLFTDRPRAEITVLKAETDFSFFLTALLVTPNLMPPSLASTTVKALDLVVSVGRCGTPLFKAHAGPIVEKYISQESFKKPLTHNTGGDDLASKAVTLAYNESLAELLMHISTSNLFAMGTKHLALQQILSLTVRLTELAKEGGVNCVEQMVYPHVCKCAWNAICTVAAPHTPSFLELVMPFIKELDGKLDETMQTPYFTKCWLYILLFAVRTLGNVNGSSREMNFKWPQHAAADPALEKADVVVQHRKDVESPSVVSDIIHGQLHSGASAFAYVSQSLHNCMATVSSDIRPIKRAKCVVLCQITRYFCDETRQCRIFVEPGSILALTAPYLLISCRYDDDNDSFSEVSIEALCVIADIVSLQTLGSPEPLVLTALGALDHALKSTDKEGWDILAQRVVAELCRNNGSGRKGVPTTNVFTIKHRFIRAFCDTWFSIAKTVLLTSKSASSSSLLLESKAAALSCLYWQTTFIYTGQSSTSERQEALSDILSAVEGAVKHRYPHQPLISMVSYIASCECNQEATVHWDIVSRALSLLNHHWCTFAASHAQVLTAASHATVDALLGKCMDAKHRVTAMKLAAVWVENLCTACLFHLSQWRLTRIFGPSFANLWIFLGTFVMKLGNVHFPVAHGMTTMIQLLGDVISFAKRGQCSQRYVVDTHTHPFSIQVYSESTYDPEQSEYLVVPPLDGDECIWPPGANEKNSSWISADDIVKLANKIESELLAVMSNFPHGSTGVQRAVCSKPRGSTLGTYLMENRSVTTISGSGDCFHVNAENACGSSGWEVSPMSGTAPHEGCREVPPIEGSNFFAKRALKANNNLATMLEDFDAETPFPSELIDAFPAEELQEADPHSPTLTDFHQASLAGKDEALVGKGFLNFLTSTGLMGLGDGTNRQKPLTGHMKPVPYCSSVKAPAALGTTCPQQCFSAGLYCGEEDSDVHELAVQVGQAFGTPSETEQHRFFESVEQTTTLRLVATDFLVKSGADFIFNLVLCKNFNDVNRVVAAVGTPAPPLVFGLPGVSPRTVVIHRLDTEQTLGSILDGICVPIKVFAGMLHATLLSQADLADDPIAQRQQVINESMALECSTFEAATSFAVNAQ